MTELYNNIVKGIVVLGITDMCTYAAVSIFQDKKIKRINVSNPVIDINVEF